MEENKKEDLITKYSRKPYAQLARPIATESKEKSTYQALVENPRPSRISRFKIVDGKGISYGCGYSYLIGWLFTPPDILTIHTTTHTFTIHGKGLDEIERSLMDEKLKELHQFNEQKHILTQDEKIKIELIKVADRFQENT